MLNGFLHGIGVLQIFRICRTSTPSMAVGSTPEQVHTLCTFSSYSLNSWSLEITDVKQYWGAANRAASSTQTSSTSRFRCNYWSPLQL